MHIGEPGPSVIADDPWRRDPSYEHDRPYVALPAAPADAACGTGRFPALDPTATYRWMALARAVDERIWSLARQGALPFAVSGRGQEAAQVGLAAALRPGADYVYAYYRDTALVLALGMSARDILLGAFGRRDDPSSGGRQMPGHFSCRRLRIVSASSPVGTQIPQAAGTALACRALGERVAVVVTFGEGAASQGDFHEGLNFAAVHRLPVVFVCENNGWAISVPQRLQCVAPIAARAAAYGIPGARVDGRDPRLCAQAAHEALARARAGGGPTLLEFTVDRLDPHTSSDDDRTYRPPEDLAAMRSADPLPSWRSHLIEVGDASASELADIDAWIAAEVEQASEEAEAAAPPEAATLSAHVTSQSPDGTPPCPR